MSYRRIEVVQHSTNFREATKITTAQIPKPKAGEVLIKNHYVGVNASDINHTSGKYKIGEKFPYPAGFESIGEIIQVGDSNSHNYRVGDAIASTNFGAFAEYQIVRENTLLKVPAIDANFLPLLVSGLTASIALEQLGHLNFEDNTQNASKRKKVVLVTAAAGGTGTFAVQLAKIANCHVIGTVGSDSKKQFLRDLGCDDVINYNTENLDDFLREKFPKGVDIVYESVGGDLFDICMRNLAIKGTLIVIGMISTYKEGIDNANSFTKFYPLQLLQKSAKIHGFFLNHYADCWQRHLLLLTSLMLQKKLISVVDKNTFNGLDQIADAIDYLYSGRNIGKVVVTLSSPSSRL